MLPNLYICRDVIYKLTPPNLGTRNTLTFVEFSDVDSSFVEWKQAQKVRRVSINSFLNFKNLIFPFFTFSDLKQTSNYRRNNQLNG